MSGPALLLAAALLPTAWAADALDEARSAYLAAPAPESPEPSAVSFLLRAYARTGERRALDAALRDLKTLSMKGERSPTYALACLEAFQATGGSSGWAARARAALDARLAAKALNWPLVSALARGAQALESPDYLLAAQKAAKALPESSEPAWVQALLDLYEASFDPALLDRALSRGKALAASGDEAAALPLLRLSQFAKSKELREAAEKLLERPKLSFEGLCGLDFARSKPQQVVIAGGLEEPGTKELLRVVRSRFLPNKVVLVVFDDQARARLARHMPFVKGARPIEGKPTAYICLNYACELPTHDPRAAADMLDGKDPLSLNPRR